MTDKSQTLDDVYALVATLQAELKALKAKITPEQRSIEDEPPQTDFVALGSDQHAAMLGLRKATEEDGAFNYEGWAFEDLAYRCGFNALPEIIMVKLRNEVNLLRSEPPVPQSKDRNAPHWAPRMWEPSEAVGVSVIFFFSLSYQ